MRQSTGVRLSVLTTLLFLVSLGIQAQVRVIRPLDIKAGLDSARIHMTIVPPFIGDSTKPFDGNPLTELAILGHDSLIITLQFDTLTRLEKTKVFFWNDGTWMVESANSLADLDGKTGTYAVLADTSSFSFFTWDSAGFPARSIRFVRLRAHNPADTNVFLGEWTLENTVSYTRLLIYPRPTRVLVGTNLRLTVRIMDEFGQIFPYFLSDPLVWTTGNQAIAIVGGVGILTGVSLGNTTVTVRNAANTISGTNGVSVESDFRSQEVSPMVAKVVLVLPDPILPGGQRLHQRYGWRDPVALKDSLVSHFRTASNGVVNFQIVQTIWTDSMYSRYNDTLLDVRRYMDLYDRGILQQPPYAHFDYIELVLHYNLDLQRNNGDIDEIWVYSPPWTGMYESQLMGPRAFWWNSPPIRTGTRLTKLLSVMGLNYERGVDQAFHSFGHRVESAMTHAYGDSWNPRSTNPTPWDLYGRIERTNSDQAQVGNVHFPPNGRSDYDYGNTAFVVSYAENWFRYPYIYDQHRPVNVSTWLYPRPEPLAEGLDHLGYMWWWYNHLPRYVGVTDRVLNNWWHYALDYEAAVELALHTPPDNVDEKSPGNVPSTYALSQNYPNPFNPSTKIGFQIAERGLVTLKVYDLLGREVTTLLHDVRQPGTYEVTWNAGGIASGVYFYRLETPMFRRVKKMLLLR